MYNCNKPFVGGLITANDFKGVVDTASILTAKVYSHNRKKDVEGISPSQLFVLAFIFVLTFLYFIFLFYGVEHQNYDLKLTAYFILAVASFIALLNTILNFY